MDSGLSHYRTALDALYARTGATSKYGLERTVELLRIVGNPHERLRTLHVAGTNGKGSVVTMLYALLRAKGLRVGRYMSPHLIDFRERIVAEDEFISEESVIAFLDRWGAEAESIGATFFEITTVMALHYFAELEVDAAVIEAGLGGRLDATNVITPAVAGITSIAIDHVEYLGHTEEMIAREKAGIFKSGVPAVIGPLSPEAHAAIMKTAGEAGVRTIVEADAVYATYDLEVTAAGTSFTLLHDGREVKVRSGLIGAQQAVNTSVALSMMAAAGPDWKVDLDTAAAILPGIQLPGRFQRIGNYVFDVAHNPDGISSVVRTMMAIDVPRPVTVVLGVLKDKDWRGMIEALAPVASRLLLVNPPTAPASRAWDPGLAQRHAETIGIPAFVEADFESAVLGATEAKGTVLVTGSFHTVGDALLCLSVPSQHP